MKLEEIDKNFATAKIDNVDINFVDVLQPPFVLEGLPFANRPCDGAPYCRLPKATLDGIAKEQDPACCTSLCKHTSGAAIRFRAKTKNIAIRYKTRESYDMSHMTRLGSMGFDLYRVLPGDLNYSFYAICAPNSPSNDAALTTSDEMLLCPGFGEPIEDECEYQLNLPLYGGVEKLELGFTPGAILLPPRPHRIKKPICFYGSSITQGGCASRPGLNYCSHLCRAVDAEQINLGFSGSAKGEMAQAELISELDLSCFVLDYDHNAPTPDQLEQTHERFYKTIRAAHPELPIIMLTKPDCEHRANDLQNSRRRSIVQQTYLNAIAAGDKKVWFVDGRTLWGTEDRDCCTVDGCHPNDIGFYRMYQAVLPTLKKALGI